MLEVSRLLDVDSYVAESLVVTFHRIMLYLFALNAITHVCGSREQRICPLPGLTMAKVQLIGDDMKTIRVLIADDHKIFRQGLISILEQEGNIEVVSESETGSEAIEACKLLSPDVVLLDISMPEMSGIVATAEIVKSVQETKVLILSMHLNEVYVAETLRSGASGYILKDCATDELINAIKSVTRGETYLSPKVATLVVNKFVSAKGVGEELVFGILSPREREILQLIAEGKTTRRMAEILFLSPKTIDNHRANIHRKLDLHDVPSLVKFAIRTGISEA